MVLIILIEAIIILLSRRWLAQSVVRLVQVLGGSTSAAIWIYSVVTLPGILAHEIAHFLIAALVGLRTGSIELLPNLTADGGVELGSVQVERRDPLRLAVVGLAPLIFGIPLLLWLSASISGNNDISLMNAFTVVKLWLIFPNSLLLYLLTSITLHMFPSNRDMKSWPVAAFFIAVIVGLLWMLGIQLPQTVDWMVKMQMLVVPLISGLALSLAAIIVSLIVIKLTTIIIIKSRLLYNKSR